LWLILIQSDPPGNPDLGAGSRRTAQAALGEQLLNIAVTQSEPGVQPNRMADDIGWQAVTL
jgi:hypothetical protein